MPKNLIFSFWSFKNCHTRDLQGGLWGKVPATKPASMSSFPTIYTVKGENQLRQVVF